MARMTVKPRDVKVGDRLDRLDPDLAVTQHEVTAVEKVRLQRSTAYRLSLVGLSEPLTFPPSASITVTREA